MPTPGEMVAKYIELRDYTKAEQEAFDARMKPYTDGMFAIEGAIMLYLNEQNLENLKAEAGTAFKVRTFHAKVTDRDALFNFVQESGAFELLTAAVSKDAVKEYMEEHQDNPPPGVDVATTTKVNFRRS